MFRFKQFSIDDSGCGHKTGTDAVLLGAWAPVSGTGPILDVGTGSGILALMLAQRSDGAVTAIEIESVAALRAAQNAASSPWTQRINVLHISLQDFTSAHINSFDTIICNPPYFSKSLSSQDTRRQLARHDDKLPQSVLISCCASLLTPTGLFCVVLPFSNAESFISSCTASALTLIRRTDVIPVTGKAPNRCLLAFAGPLYPPVQCTHDTLTIRNAELDNTEVYKTLTHAYLLNS